MTSSPSLERHLHADDDGFLADIQVAEAADQAHAVELAGLFLEPADQQHGAIGFQQQVAIDGLFLGLAALSGFSRLRHDRRLPLRLPARFVLT